MGSYHPNLMKFDTQTKKNILSSKVTKAEVTDRFQDGRRRHVGNSSACYKMGNYHRTLMKIGTQTKTDMLSSKVRKTEAYGKKTAKIKYRLMHGCFHIGFHIRPDSSYLPDEGGQIWILIFALLRRANMKSHICPT
jgi:hypothetical protein